MKVTARTADTMVSREPMRPGRGRPFSRARQGFADGLTEGRGYHWTGRAVREEWRLAEAGQ